MTRKILSLFILLLLSGCGSSGTQPEKYERNKDDPYKNSTVNTIRENQEIYREQLRTKGIW
ncbi:hypothetical protein [Morganella morganii]|uniref:hypothetical protein n=1 Tax=Morganella morganii TaxID=582 RepID=UPI00236856C0|nr:hypothetical protein [Morganella morganii]